MKSRALVLVAVVAVLAGCAVQPVPLSKKALSVIERADVVLVVPQNNLEVSIEATNPGNTGLIGALIVAAVDAKRQSNAEKGAAPFMDALRDYDFRPAMLKATTDALSGVTQVLFESPQRVVTIDSESSRRVAFDDSKASAVLFYKVTYHLQSGGLFVTADAEMYSKVDELKPIKNTSRDANPIAFGNAIYRRTFTFTVTVRHTPSIRPRLDAISWPPVE
jgi:hypothetical protein